MVKIEKAKKEDIPFILEIEKNAFPTPWSVSQFNDSIDNIYIAKEDSAVKGFICAEKIIDEVHILHMAVHSDYRRKGIAKRMMEKALSIPAKKYFLEVRESNLPAQKLYNMFGFTTISKRKDYYQDNMETAYVMELKKNV